MKNYISIFLLLVIPGLQSCNETIIPEGIEGGFTQAYYSLNTDSYRVYAVEEINYSADQFDTSFYELRESIVDTVFDELNNAILFKVIREKREMGQETFEVDSIWNGFLNETYLSITENGTPFVKLTFPVEIDKSWDVNAQNTKSRDLISYSAISSQGDYSDFISLDSIVGVEISNIPKNLVNQSEHYELYGNGIGLLEKRTLQLNFCTVDCDSSNQINSGKHLFQQLIQIN